MQSDFIKDHGKIAHDFMILKKPPPLITKLSSPVSCQQHMKLQERVALVVSVTRLCKSFGEELLLTP